MKFESKFKYFYSSKCIWKCRLPKCRPLCPGEDDLSSEPEDADTGSSFLQVVTGTPFNSVSTPYHNTETRKFIFSQGMTVTKLGSTAYVENECDRVKLGPASGIVFWGQSLWRETKMLHNCGAGEDASVVNVVGSIPAWCRTLLRLPYGSYVFVFLWQSMQIKTWHI